MRNAIVTFVLALFVAVAWNSSTSAFSPAATAAATRPAATSSWSTGATGALGSVVYDVVAATGSPGVVEIDLRSTGEYRSAEWMVILDYQSLTIAAGTTVKFINHPSRAPVVIRAVGPIEILGELNLDGADGHANNEIARHAEPGPGGFRGGLGYKHLLNSYSDGHGPGGAYRVIDSTGSRAGGSYATLGQTEHSTVKPGPTYGSVGVLQLIGGSGGKGQAYFSDPSGGGGAGGGAILLGSNSSINISGVISARGGLGGVAHDALNRHRNAGSGGAIRLASPVITWTAVSDGSGRPNLIADDGSDANYPTDGLGWIRVETLGAPVGGPIPSMPGADDSSTLPEFLPSALPTVTVLQWLDASTNTWHDINQDPRAVIEDTDVDVKLPISGLQTLRLEGQGVPQHSVLHVRTTYTLGKAVIDSSHVMGEVGGAPPGRLWTDVQVDFTPGISTVQVRAEFP